MLVPPENFGLVELGVYRCSKFELDNLPFLETLNLRSIVLLDAEKPPRSLESFLSSNNIALYNIGGLKISNHHHTGINSGAGDEYEEWRHRRLFSDLESIDLTSSSSTTNSSRNNRNDLWMLIEKNLILRAFELILNRNKHNLLLVDSLLTLVGILRKIQRWNFNSVVNEYRIYAGSSSKHNYFAENFLDLIQLELIPYESSLTASLESIDTVPMASTTTMDHPSTPTSCAIPIRSNGQSQSQSGGQSGGQLTSPSAMFNSIYSGTQLVPRGGPSGPSGSICGTPVGRLGSVSSSTSTTSSRRRGLSAHSLISASPSTLLGEELSVNHALLLAGVFGGDDDGDDDDDDTDDDLLSASPQIPANLLKLAERRKMQRLNLIEDRITPGSSPRNITRPPNSSRQSEMLISLFGSRRRSSLDTKLWSQNSKFKSPLMDLRRREGIETRKSIAEPRPLKSYRFYKNIHRHPVAYENVQVIRIRLPQEEKLPEWFLRARNLWERRVEGIE